MADPRAPEPGENPSGSLPPLPEAVRARLISLTASVLPSVPQLPPSLRKVATFAAARRARLGANQLATELERDEAFRGHVVTQLQVHEAEVARLAEEPAQAAEPVDLAAMAWLARPEGWVGTFTDAVRRVEDRALDDSVARRAEALDRAVRRAEEAEEALRELRSVRRQELETLKAENTALRRKLGDARTAERAAAGRADDTARQLEEARSALAGAASAGEAEVRRLRRRVEEVEAQLAGSRRTARTDRDEATLRARLLLDTLIEAGTGLRRELALPAVEGAPGDRVEAVLAESGSRDPSSASSLGQASPALLEQYLSMPRARLVIDGYNVTKSAWPASSLEAQRLRLVSGLTALVARTGAETTVVFDAAASAARGVGSVPRGVKVLFSPAGVIADDVIRDLVTAEPTGRVVIVVTSDQELARDVVRSGARTVAATSLVPLLG
ncbi:NYN domain-containing protein [Nocardioides sp.]|uniref:NYN domain-containing protein n=1 Tax=Nocardioides sp. TaxID=35761 RepID=UPI0027376E21|nr:NYN domain-containing protein [Nocardioides sp.]MDP3894130.1 NYN domain-containing protein [Nocardioides sp.]